VVYVQLEEGFEYCQALAERLRPVLPQTCNRFPYHPHVTLADLTDTEALDRAQYAMNALDECFEVLEVAVSEFHPERGWRLLSALPLGGSKPPGQILPPALGDAQ
jgi:2'-5' RNA ligase